jgi:DNA-binding NarL/FixJ family response regulator
VVESQIEQQQPWLFRGGWAVSQVEAPVKAAESADYTINGAATKVLIVDHYHDRRQLMSYVVELCGNDVSVVGYAEGPTDATSGVVRWQANVALIEMQAPTALETIKSLRTEHPNLRIVVCSFFSNAEARRSALEHGADVYLTKPISPRELDPKLRAPLPSQLEETHQG